MYKSLALSTAISISLSALPAAAQNCNLRQSVYRDANGKGFELIFSQPATRSASSYATAVIRQSKAGELYRFSVTQSNGYGSTVLFDPKRANDESSSGYVINFFDKNLVTTTFMLGRETTVPKYAFINGLGSTDYYRFGRREALSQGIPLLLDTMWVFSRCQK